MCRFCSQFEAVVHMSGTQHPLYMGWGPPLPPPLCLDMKEGIFLHLQYTRPSHRGTFEEKQRWDVYSTPPFLQLLGVTRWEYPKLLHPCCSYKLLRVGLLGSLFKNHFRSSSTWVVEQWAVHKLTQFSFLYH